MSALLVIPFTVTWIDVPANMVGKGYFPQKLGVPDARPLPKTEKNEPSAMAEFGSGTSFGSDNGGAGIRLAALLIWSSAG